MPSRGPAIDLADSGRFLGQHGHAESVQAEGHSTANGLDQRLFSGPAIKEGLIAFVTRQRSQLGRFVMGKKILRNKQCIRHGTHGFQVDTDIDAHCARAHEYGAQIIEPPTTQFYGDRTYRCRDPEGHIWNVSQTVEVVSREEAEAASGLKITGWV